MSRTQSFDKVQILKYNLLIIS